MVTRVGDDIFADNTISNLNQFGVDTRHVRKVPGKSSGVAPIFVEPSGENSILIVKGANADLLPAEVDRAADDLKSCGLILMQMEVPVETVYHTIAFAAENGIETILNPAPAAADLDPELIRQVTFLVPNESELAILSGLPTGTDDEIVTAARSLIARGIRTVIVTLGGRGARMITASEIVNIPPVKVTPKDTTGAGDAFIGSFARFTQKPAMWKHRFAKQRFMRPIPSPGPAHRKPMPVGKNSKRSAAITLPRPNTPDRP